MKGQIFINYRRDDSSSAARLIFDRLKQHFGPDRIFIDIDKIELGVDFVRRIEEAVGKSEVLVVVIGRHWLTSTNEQGQRRLEDPNDFVRLEIATALEKGTPVIPALVDGADMPREDDLPDILKPLPRQNGLEIGHTRFDTDVNRLINGIEFILNAGGDDGYFERGLVATIESAPRIDVDKQLSKLIMQLEAGEGKSFYLKPGKNIIGRDDRLGITIDNDSVSREHAQIYCGADYYELEDLGSTNGTYVNGEEVTEPRQLKDGDMINIGQVVFAFRIPEDKELPSLPVEDSLDDAKPSDEADEAELIELGSTENEGEFRELDEQSSSDRDSIGRKMELPPWVWIVGGVVSVLILALLVYGSTSFEVKTPQEEEFRQSQIIHSDADPPTQFSSVRDEPTETVEPTLTPSPLVPLATARELTTCRNGPGAEYDEVVSLESEQTVVVEGFDNSDTWLWVINPIGDGNCWVEVSLVSLVGSLESLSIIELPTSTATLIPPTEMPNPLIEVRDTWTVALKDTFDSNDNNWSVGDRVGDQGTIRNTIQEGSYFWEQTRVNEIYFDYEIVPPTSYSDFYFQIEVQRVFGNRETAYGLVFRYQNFENFYYFWISDEGQYQFDAWVENERIEIIPWGSYTDLVVPGEVNTIAILAEGTMFTVFVNDQFLIQEEDTNLDSGLVGISTAVGEALELYKVKFDSLEVRVP